MNLKELKQFINEEVTPPEEFYLKRFKVRELIACIDVLKEELKENKAYKEALEFEGIDPEQVLREYNDNN